MSCIARKEDDQFDLSNKISAIVKLRFFTLDGSFMGVDVVGVSVVIEVECILSYSNCLVRMCLVLGLADQLRDGDESNNYHMLHTLLMTEIRIGETVGGRERESESG